MFPARAEKFLAAQRCKEMMYRNFRTSAYTNGGENWQRKFTQYDRDQVPSIITYTTRTAHSEALVVSGVGVDRHTPCRLR
jgi:hypothetical protein